MELRDTQEACKWLRGNISLDTDTLMLDFEQLAFAVKMGWLIPVGDTGAFVTKTFENFWGTYEVTDVYRVSDDVIRENLLIYPYRCKATLIKESQAFKEIEDEIVKEDMRAVDNAILAYADYTVINNYYKEAKTWKE